MATRATFRSVSKENRVPLGKKKENLDKIGLQKKNEAPELVINGPIPKKKKYNAKKKAKNTTDPLKLINLNMTPTDTSLTKPMKKSRLILSTIKELEEKALKSIMINKAKSKKINILINDTPIEDIENLEESTKLVENLQEKIDIDDFNNTVNEMNVETSVPEVVLSPYVCTTRGKKWKPTPCKPPKLSELFDKYEDDNVADKYKKKLDAKTNELQNKVKYWVELSSENTDIPQFAQDEIDVVCGQTKLLTTDKFMQMRSLIEEFDNKSGPMPITTCDLDGFWDMLLLQVQKLEGQFGQLAILKENNWVPLEPIAKKVINKGAKIKKLPAAKSKIGDFLKKQRFNHMNSSPKVENAPKNVNGKNDASSRSKFNEFKSSNTNNYLISSTPSSSNEKTVCYTPVLLKTLELSFVARRSGMTPICLVEPHVSPLKPALKNGNGKNQEKGTTRKNIHFESPKVVSDGFITPENSRSAVNHNCIQDRVDTPHTIKTTAKGKDNIINVESKVKSTKSTNTKNTKSSVRVKANKMTTVKEKPIETQINESSNRRSSRLANKPSKNYKI